MYEDDYILEYLVNHTVGGDRFGDAANYSYEFLRGFREAEAGKTPSTESGWSIAQQSAYDMGRYEYENS